MPRRSASFFIAGGEELLVELHEHVLARLAVVEALRAKPHALVEALQVARLVLKSELPEVPAQRIQRLRHRVPARKIVLLEQRLEYGPRENVLRHHLDGAAGGDRTR